MTSVNATTASPKDPPGRGTIRHDDAALQGTLTASRALLGVIARSLAPVMDSVTLPQFRVLVVLSNFGPLRMGELAAHLGANQSSFSRFADRMVSGGLIERSASPGSRREILISLTGKGQQVYAEVTDARRREISIVLERLSAAELEAVRTGFEVFARAAGEPAADETLILGI
ncbi:MarR family winged helix-turn-helix transcriptional regulator [Arthrobacter terricola]|uniref:MarR family transcriptional regulator n=1 Tax=Arthrobacter terricola TaxID=2547396 RepID=A0A4R5K956_9MICC|nr:MarR family transcriptional regulator [Arthrobacter terricola]MBT8163237.1 MarR family transcriptional regulator [Arthrobacter sp. GN70]TDF91506.1 MarR family transcriptional regulator [Arthrobacter terricola]